MDEIAAQDTLFGAPPPALEAWWTHFNDPALTRIIERVLDLSMLPISDGLTLARKR